MKFIFEFIKFLLTFLILFTIFFVIMNYEAFSSKISYFLKEKKINEVFVETVKEDIDNNLLNLEPKEKTIKKEFPNLNISITPLEYRLVIPKISKNVPVIEVPERYISEDIWTQFDKEVQNLLRQWVIHYPGTAGPGQVGNAFFTWHSSYYPWDKWQYKDVFANLNQMEIGDTYFIYSNQKKYKYKIVDKKEIKPSEVNVLSQPNNAKISTLMTCWPLGTTLRRLIVVGEQVE